MTDANPTAFQFLLYWVVAGLAVLMTSKIISGFRVSGFLTACLTAVVIAIGNAVLWPVLFFLTLPINVLTLGFFTFVVNAAVLKICAALMPGFEIEGWWAAIFGSIVLSILNGLLHYFFV